MRDSIKGFSKIQKDYVSLLLFIYQLGELIEEGDKIANRGISFNKLMLTIPNNNTVFSMPLSIPQTPKSSGKLLRRDQQIC